MVVVSSGAVAAGLGVLGLTQRPTDMPTLQAAAAGQSGLATLWETCFRSHGLASSQILPTHEDLSDRTRYKRSGHGAASAGFQRHPSR